MMFRCYCCGDEIDFLRDSFAVVALSEETDRVFIMKPEHVERVQDGHAVIVEALD